MNNHPTHPRRHFLIQSASGAIGAVAATTTTITQAQSNNPQETTLRIQGYQWLTPSEQSFVESLVDHMCPADDLSQSGVELGLNIYFDRALGGEWGQGHRLYLKGPFQKGTENQGYQLGLTPCQFFRAGTRALDQHCQHTFHKSFENLSSADKEQVLLDLQSGKIEFDNSVPAKTYFGQLLQMFYEAMFADPIYGGNRDKKGWKMIGYPGVITNNKLNIVRYKNKPFPIDPKSIADLT
jgi:gluconate 2-dehydrogenase gamma chain